MKHELLVVASTADARLFTRELSRDPLQPLDHLHEVESPEALASSSAHFGRRQRGDGRAAVPLSPRTDLKHKQAAAFARRVSQRIDEDIKDGDCRQLIVIASSPLLGPLRKALSPAARSLLRLSVDLDLTSYPLDQLELRVADALRAHPAET
jgi:protein required for attachment to host cells